MTSGSIWPLFWGPGCPSESDPESLDIPAVSILNLNRVCSHPPSYPPRLPTNLDHQCQDSPVVISAGTVRDGTPAPQSQPLPRRPRLHTWPLKEHPWHPSLPRRPACRPCQPEEQRHRPAPHPIYSHQASAQSGRGQAAGPLACGSGLSFGAGFPGTGLGRSNLGALQGHSFPISASPALFWLKAS